MMETWPAIEVGGHGLVLQRRQRRVQAEVDEPVAVTVVPLPFDLILICNFLWGRDLSRGTPIPRCCVRGGQVTKPDLGLAGGRGSWFVDVDGDGDGTYLVWFQRLERWAWSSQGSYLLYCLSICQSGCSKCRYVLMRVCTYV